jgi:hypothetical protein
VTAPIGSPIPSARVTGRFQDAAGSVATPGTAYPGSPGWFLAGRRANVRPRHTSQTAGSSAAGSTTSGRGGHTHASVEEHHAAEPCPCRPSQSVGFPHRRHDRRWPGASSTHRGPRSADSRGSPHRTSRSGLGDCRTGRCFVATAPPVATRIGVVGERGPSDRASRDLPLLTPRSALGAAGKRAG